MLRKILIELTDKLADLFIIVGITSLADLFFDWYWELTRPEREKQVREFIRKALRGSDHE